MLLQTERREYVVQGRLQDVDVRGTNRLRRECLRVGRGRRVCLVSLATQRCRDQTLERHGPLERCRASNLRTSRMGLGGRAVDGGACLGFAAPAGDRKVCHVFPRLRLSRDSTEGDTRQRLARAGLERRSGALGLAGEVVRLIASTKFFQGGARGLLSHALCACLIPAYRLWVMVATGLFIRSIIAKTFHAILFKRNGITTRREGL